MSPKPWCERDPYCPEDTWDGFQIVCTANLDNPDWQSNVALIRAAPELLEICEAYLHLLDRPAPNPEGVWSDLITKPMRVIVAKAKGNVGRATNDRSPTQTS